MTDGASIVRLIVCNCSQPHKGDGRFLHVCKLFGHLKCFVTMQFNVHYVFRGRLKPAGLSGMHGMLVFG